jgi:rhodanese-related sulfurtransferase
VGVTPNSRLAAEAGLACHPGGGIIVNSHMQTSDPDIYAGGDCIVTRNLISGELVHLPLGSMANRQGRVIGTNVAGGADVFEGVVGSWCVKLHKMSAAGTGLTEAQARQAGFDAVAAMLQFSRPTLNDLSNLEIAYSPPFASAMDAVNTVANVADNVLSGTHKAVAPEEFAALWRNRADNHYAFVDVRPGKAPLEMALKYPGEWLSIPLEELDERIGEIPADRPVALICNSGLRAFETQLTLRRRGINSVNSSGGMQAMKKRGQKF